MSDFGVRHAQISDQTEIAKMCALLWPDSPMEEHHREIGHLLKSGMSGTLPAAILVSHEDDGALTGFLQVGLRSHADGCDTAQPVGFVEGWFVYESLRGQGIDAAVMARPMLGRAHRGCAEMASDTWIDHTDSQKAHQALGFEVVDRCVHFRKTL